MSFMAKLCPNYPDSSGLVRAKKLILKNYNMKITFIKRNKQKKHFEPENNWYGFERVQIIEFNYDGNGNILVMEDGELSYISDDVFRFLAWSGWYDYILENEIFGNINNNYKLN